ncbi:hypothetical protein ACS0TY_002103 [Phlomoides rotata]
MSSNKKVETPELSASALKSDSSINLPEKDMGRDGIPKGSVPFVSAAGNAASGAKDALDQQLASEQGVYYPPTSCYDYYYPGLGNNFAQSDDKGYFNAPGGSYTGIQQDNPSLLYYVPGYGPYSSGYMGADGKQAYTSSYGSEAFPCYTYDLASYAGNGSTSAASKPGSMGSMVSPSRTGKSNGYNVAKTNNNFSSRTSASHFYPQNQQPHSSRSMYQNNQLNKVGSGFQSSGLMGGFYSGGISSASRYPRSSSQYGSVNYQSNARAWNNNYRSKSRENSGRGGDLTGVTELTRGPRADSKSNSAKSQSEDEQLSFAVDRDRYNLTDFQTVYEHAKFYVIKSYSEDDVHKCIKYDVWSSTPNGNKKLDAAFREADAKTTETGIKCPVFLFFSVNASGQFVGVAEMIGHVDFTKNMDFWQLDKWNGFFPIKWHIIKDVPNTLLRHIVLENNENKAVTYSRDTQEIELKQGLEMLGIFMNHMAKTCVLDDFNFYENREKALKEKRNASQTRKSDYEGGEDGKSDELDLASLAQNLSLDSQALQSSI